MGASAFQKTDRRKPNKQKVLLVDEDDRLIKLLELTLEDGRYRLLNAGDGVVGLEMVRKEKPDLLALDALMPGKKGFDLCREIKASSSTAGTRVVILSGLDEREARHSALEAGDDDYLAKPFSPMDLIAKVERGLGLDGRRRPHPLAVPAHSLSA